MRIPCCLDSLSKIILVGVISCSALFNIARFGLCCRLVLQRSVAGALLLTLSLPFSAAARTPRRPPNIVLIFCDDLAYADVGCFGAKNVRTPNIDRLARAGTRFTSFYVSQPVCSASRASLLTGCYANRIGIHGALSPNSKIAMNTNEWTLARSLKAAGYATAMFGKWHLGQRAPHLPTAYGFDEYFGLPYSNDMWPNHPEAMPGAYPPLPLIEGREVIELMPDQRLLTRRYTERAVAFVRNNADRPFFLYLAHSMPHVPLFASSDFAGRSPHGLFADVIEELDWSVGQVLSAVHDAKLEKDTWVIFTSDNGPWLSYGDHAGSAGKYREGKGTVFEGGVRVPCIMSWPGKIPEGRECATPMMTIDLYPTIACRANAPMGPLVIDGRDAWSVVSAKVGAKSAHSEYLFYYNTGELQAMRSGRWKLLFPHKSRTLAGRDGGRGGNPAKYEELKVGLELYDLESDPSETRNVASQRADVVTRLQAATQRRRLELGDSLTGIAGTGIRPPARVE
ncbi:MAG: arylsulfatase [Pedosphaera sp.]|nr:arylsulfatase [Pedosphaera sp.]